MSRDDYISKLFIKNQDKLEQAPSADLWSKLEAELDAPTPTATPTLFPKAWGVYAAAASVLLAVLAGTWYVNNDALKPQTDPVAAPMALNTTPTAVVEEAEPYEEPTEVLGDVNANIVLEAKEEEEVRAQEQRIVEAVQKRLEEKPLPKINQVEPIAMEDIVVADELALEQPKLIEPAQNNYSFSQSGGGQQPAINFYQNNQPVAPQQNYSNSIPQIAVTSANAEVEEVLRKNTTKDYTIRKKEQRQREMDEDDALVEQAEKIQPGSMDEKVARSSTSSRRGGIVARAKESDKIKSPMAGAHPRLRPFGFLLGRWDDEYEVEGRSYEIWTLKDRNTLVGRGYKLSNDAARIFEERFRIEFRNNQIFLVMSFAENQQQVDYMLSSFDQERFVFEQKGRSKYPDKVILQKDGLQGYSITIANSSDFLTADQQRYLEHRNRVSNVRSIRTLRHTQ